MVTIHDGRSHQGSLGGVNHQTSDPLSDAVYSRSEADWIIDEWVKIAQSQLQTKRDGASFSMEEFKLQPSRRLSTMS